MSADSLPFIYASIIASVPDLIDDQGGRIERPFRAAGVPIELVGEPEKIIPIPGYLGLLEAAAHETGDRSFGVSMAACLRIEDLGPFGQLVTGAASLGKAIEVTGQMVRHYSNAISSWLTIEGATAYWRYHLADGGNHREGHRMDCEQSLVLYRTVIRLAAGPDWQPDEFLVERATSEQLRALQSRLGAAARADNRGYAIAFPRHLLDLPMTYATTSTAIERQLLIDRLPATKPKESIRGSVEAVVSGRLSGGYPDIATVAQSLDHSVRTLQRRLGDEGVIYSDLVDNVRHGLAVALLADPANSQLDTALAIGYREAASFSRSFKRWTGQTPRDYRRELREVG